MPLTVMTLPRRQYIGAGYYLLPFTLARLFGTSRPMYFMVDSGLTGTLLTPQAQEYLYAIPTQTTVQGPHPPSRPPPPRRHHPPRERKDGGIVDFFQRVHGRVDPTDLRPLLCGGWGGGR